MERPRTHTDPRITTAVRLPQSLYERLKDEAAERDTSLNHLVVKGPPDNIDRLPPLEVSDERVSLDAH
jgi:predicted HicB family RNase H-like nuclease